MTLFRNKYRIESARLQNWNYANEGAYFVTICTKDRLNHFGKIVVETPCMASNNNNINDTKMDLSEIGKILESEWLKTPEIRPDMNLQLGAFVVMPNHFHAIIIIGENEHNSATVETPCMASLQSTPVQSDNNQFGAQRKNLASIIRGFKSAVTVQARAIQSDFAWQHRFHDHIIRNDDEYMRIENYIINNPMNWKVDKFHQS